MDLDSVFLPLANAAGASVEQIKVTVCSIIPATSTTDRVQFISCLLVAFPLGSVFVRIPSSQPALKHLFNIGITLFFFFPVLKVYGAFFQLLASVMATYTVTKYDRSSRMPWVVFACATIP